MQSFRQLGEDIFGGWLGVELSGGGSAPLIYLLRDDFMTDVAAPLTSPRTAEPGPGTLTLVQNDGQFSTSSGKLNFPAQATANWGDQGFYEAAGRSRAAGRAIVAALSVGASNKSQPLIGWNEDQGVFIASSSDAWPYASIYFRGDGLLWAGATASPFVNLGSYSASTDYKLAIILRTTGSLLAIKGGAYTNWIFLWLDNSETDATVYPSFSNYDNSGTLDTFRVLDLPAPFDSDYGLATQRLAGARTLSDAFTHTADGILEYTVVALPNSGSTFLDVAFRLQDTNNYWDISIGNTGALTLYEKVAGAYTQRASAAAVVSAGHRVVIVFEGTTIRAYSNNVLRWTYSSAATFTTATSGRVDLLTGSSAISDIISWPRTLTGAAANLLEAAVA